MLSFPTREIGDGAVHVAGVLDPDDKVWLESDERPRGAGIGVTGRVSEAGQGRYYFSGSIDGEV